MSYTIDSRRAMRFSVDGWVENTSPINPRAPGSAMHAKAIDLMLSNDFVRAAVLIFRNAFANANGLRVMCAPVASAADSRLRDTANRKIGVIIVLNTKNANHTINKTAPDLLSSLSHIVCDF